MRSIPLFICCLERLKLGSLRRFCACLFLSRISFAQIRLHLHLYFIKLTYDLLDRSWADSELG